MEGLEVAGIAAVVIAAKEVANFVLLGIRKMKAEERQRVEEKEKDDRLQTEAVRRDKVDSTVRAMPAIEEQLRDHEVRLKATEDNMKKVLDNQLASATNQDKQLEILVKMQAKMGV
jgi:hypothetical protein